MTSWIRRSLARIGPSALAMVWLASFASRPIPKPPVEPSLTQSEIDQIALQQAFARWAEQHSRSRPGYCDLHKRILEPACQDIQYHGLVTYWQRGWEEASVTLFPHSRLVDHVSSCVGSVARDRLTMMCPTCRSAEQEWQRYVKDNPGAVETWSQMGRSVMEPL